MRPIIIGITKDGKVDMTLDEFRKHMDDAYSQGYRDGTSITAPSDGRWWGNQPYCNTCECKTTLEGVGVSGPILDTGVTDHRDALSTKEPTWSNCHTDNTILSATGTMKE